VDKDDSIHIHFFVQKESCLHTELPACLYWLQVIDFVGKFCLIHRKRAALTTTTKPIYLLCLIKQEHDSAPKTRFEDDFEKPDRDREKAVKTRSVDNSLDIHR
jgi:hypothetical protein